MLGQTRNISSWKITATTDAPAAAAAAAPRAAAPAELDPARTDACAGHRAHEQPKHHQEVSRGLQLNHRQQPFLAEGTTLRIFLQRMGCETHTV